MSEASIGSFVPFIRGVKEVRPSSGEISNSPELQGENMSKIVSTDGACVLSRYMAAMAVAIGSTTDSPPNKDSENEESTENSGRDR
jgi:hypothetical protein